MAVLLTAPATPGTSGYSLLIADDPSQLSATGSEAALKIPLGQVAITIPMTRLSGVGYALSEGDHVNVLVSLLFVDVSETNQTVLPDTSQLISVTTDAETGNVTIQLLDLGDRGELISDPALPDTPLFVQPSEPQRPRLVCQMVLQNVVVMNLGNFQLQAPVADPNVTPSAAQVQQDAAPDIITLMVTPQDSIALNYFMYSGATMSMALRNSTDNSRIDAQSATLTSLLTQYNISLPSKLPYGQQPRLDVLAPPLLPNDIINVQPQQ